MQLLPVELCRQIALHLCLLHLIRMLRLGALQETRAMGDAR